MTGAGECHDPARLREEGGESPATASPDRVDSGPLAEPSPIPGTFPMAYSRPLTGQRMLVYNPFTGADARTGWCEGGFPAPP